MAKKKATSKKAPAKRTSKRSAKKAAPKRTPSTRKKSVGRSAAKQAVSNRRASARTVAAKPTKRAQVGAKRTSLLDAAAAVLAEAKEPMSCRAIVDEVLKRKLWTTKGATPHQTLHAAIIRDIASKGKAGRFKKVARGRFAANR